MIEKLTNFLINNEIIEDGDKEIYKYGLRQGLLMVINIITTILIGLFLGMMWESILFLITYIPLRTYGGGYHAKTEVGCYLFSVMLNFVVLLGINLIPMTYLTILSLTGICGTLIWILAPIEDSNKPLSQVEKQIYKSKTRAVLIMQILIIIILLILNFKEIALIISMSILTLSFMLLLAKMKFQE